ILSSMLFVSSYGLADWNPVVYRRARVLSPGQSVLNFHSFFAETSQRRTQRGELEPLGSPFNQELSWAEVLSESGGEDLEIKEFLTSQGVALQEAAAYSEVEVRQRLWTFSPRGAYGLTESWTVGFEVPLHYQSTV